MNCPHCQAPLADPPPRFCDACGLAVGAARPAAKTKREEPPEVRCPECGRPARTRRCRGCGARVRWPEGVIPPDEAV